MPKSKKNQQYYLETPITLLKKHYLYTTNHNTNNLQNSFTKLVYFSKKKIKLLKPQKACFVRVCNAFSPHDTIPRTTPRLHNIHTTALHILAYKSKVNIAQVQNDDKQF